jgi:hypothetical protein
MLQCGTKNFPENPLCRQAAVAETEDLKKILI